MENFQTESRRGQGRIEDSPYLEWQRGEDIPTYTGSFVPSLYDLAVAPWPRTGQNGAFVNLARQEIDGGQLLEIAPSGQTEVQHPHGRRILTAAL